MTVATSPFHPAPQIETVRLDDGGHVYVIDDVLADPQRLVDWCAAQLPAFRPVDFNAYPGTWLPSPAPLDAALDDFSWPGCARVSMRAGCCIGIAGWRW